MTFTPNALGSEYLVNTQTSGAQASPCIATLADGGYVICWVDYGETAGDSSGSAIKAQIYEASGTKRGVEFLVNTMTIVEHLET